MPWAVFGEELCLGTNAPFPCSSPLAAASRGTGLRVPAAGGVSRSLPWLPASPPAPARCPAARGKELGARRLVGVHRSQAAGWKREEKGGRRSREIHSRIIVLRICVRANCLVHWASNGRHRGVAREIWCQMEFSLFEGKKTLFYDSVCSKAHEVNMPVNWEVLSSSTDSKY